MAIKLSGLTSGMDTDSMVKELMSAHSLKLTKIQNKKTLNNWTQDKWKELNTKIYALYTGELSTMRLPSSYKTKSAASSNSSSISVEASATAAAGAHQIEVSQVASSQFVTGAKIQGEVKSSSKLMDLGSTSGPMFQEGEEIFINGKSVLTVTADTKVSDFVSACKKEGITANLDTSNGRMYLSSNKSGAENAFTIESKIKDASGADMVSTNSLQTLGLGNMTKTGDTVVCDNSQAFLVQAQDAKYTFDGVEMTSDSNDTSVNGVKISIKETTKSPVTVTVSNDNKAVYNMVKKFVGAYNALLGEMNTAYYANSAKGYDPLTDDEKSVMSDSQIEKWESKIQGSLLRRDTTLGTTLNSMKSAMSSSVVVDGKSYSLASLGICTSSDWTEKGLLHIQGDADDNTYADKTNKLESMLESDPDTVAAVLQGISEKLFNTMQNQMKATSMSSALTVYNDKQLTKYDKQYEKDITSLQSKLATIEDRYYAQFTAMETAMAKLNSQQSNLASMLG